MIDLDSLITPHQATFSISAVIDTALCIGAGGSTGSLSGKAIVRNAQKQLIIPGSHLKGRLRHECEKLARSLGWWIAESPDAKKLCAPIPHKFLHQQNYYQVTGYSGMHCYVSQIFGNPILPSRIVIDDLVCPYAPETLPESIRSCVSINRARQTAEDQKLFFLETSPAHAQLPFTGDIHLLTGCPSYAPALLRAAFSHISAIGGSKSTGLGWLTWTQLPIIPSEFNWSSLQAP